jgi:hypothetical protein
VPQVGQVELYGFLNKSENFFFGLSDRDTARQIGDVRSVGSGPLLNYDEITHLTSPPTLKACLLEYAGERTGRYVLARFAGYGNSSPLEGMVKLAVAASDSYQKPAVSFNEGHQLTYLHQDSDRTAAE